MFKLSATERAYVKDPDSFSKKSGSGLRHRIRRKARIAEDLLDTLRDHDFPIHQRIKVVCPVCKTPRVETVILRSELGSPFCDDQCEAINILEGK